MEIIKANDFDEFLIAFNKLSNSGDSYYRGQANESWSLVPGLGRNKNIQKPKDIKRKEKEILKLFRKQIKHEGLTDLVYIQPNGYGKEWQWWMIGQHYGLPTRLLDFSTDKDYALQFAITDLSLSKTDGAFLIYRNTCALRKGVDDPILQGKFNDLDESFMFKFPFTLIKIMNSNLVNEEN